MTQGSGNRRTVGSNRSTSRSKRNVLPCRVRKPAGEEAFQSGPFMEPAIRPTGRIPATHRRKSVRARGLTARCHRLQVQAAEKPV